MTSEDNNEYSFVDEKGIPVIDVRQCPSFPDDVLYNITDPTELKRMGYLAAQACQGVINTHGKTVELIFKPHIQQGLKDGAYTMMKTSAGETLADVVHTGGKQVGKIAGKGRIIESGKLKQIASGSFQLISLMVAQAHLADISQSLADIKESVEKLHNKIDNTHLARIEGRVHYLEGLVEKLRRGDFDYDVSLQIKNKIEDTVADAYEWQSILFADLKTLHASARALKDSDTFGTGDTYQKLKTIAEGINPLVQRRNVLLKLAALLAYIQACIDPTNKDFSQFDLQRKAWEEQLTNFVSVINEKAVSFLTNSRFNSEEMLVHRRYFIATTLDTAKSIAAQSHAHYETCLLQLKNNHRRILTENGKLRLAVSHDEQGNMLKAAVID